MARPISEGSPTPFKNRAGIEVFGDVLGVAPRVYIVRKENKRKKGGEREKGIDSHAVHMCQIWCVSMLMNSGILPQGVVSMFMPGFPRFPRVPTWPYLLSREAAQAQLANPRSTLFISKI